MKRNYECMVLLDNREVRKGWDATKDMVNGLLTKHGAEIVSSKLWEERKLAYPINHQDRGTYLLVYFNAETSCVTPINREMRIAEPVLRHMVLACEDIPEGAHEPEKEFDVSKIGEEPEPTPEPEAADPEAAEPEAEKAGDAKAESPAAESGGAAASTAGAATEGAGADENSETKSETKEES